MRWNPLLVLTLVLAASLASTQQSYQSNEDDILARLSYDSSALLQGPGVSHICLAVSRDGDYRIIRSIEDRPALLLRGTMTERQFGEFKQLLEAGAFRILLSSPGHLIYQDAESFHAEFPLGDRMHGDENRQYRAPKTRRMEWLNADGENPFPRSIAKMIDWMQRFNPKGADAFEYDESSDVCPWQPRVIPPIAENR